MNAVIQFLKANSLKASLPLLLLVTACGDSAPTAQQSDQATSAAESVLAAAQPSGNFGVPSVDSAPLEAPEVTLPEDESGAVTSFEDVLPPSNADGSDSTDVANAAGVDDAVAAAESVPEPAALAGLVLAAAGLVTIKRKQSA